MMKDRNTQIENEVVLRGSYCRKLLRVFLQCVGLVFVSMMINPASAAPISCDGGICVITEGDSTLRVGDGIPRVEYDGFGSAVKTSGQVFEWSVRGIDQSFATGIFYSFNGNLQNLELTDISSSQGEVDEDGNVTKLITKTYSSFIDPIDITATYKLFDNHLPYTYASSQLAEVLKVDYTGLGVADIDLFLYRDWDLNGTESDSRVSATSDCREIRQFEGNARIQETTVATVTNCGTSEFGGKLATDGGQTQLLQGLDMLSSFPKEIIVDGTHGDLNYATQYSFTLDTVNKSRSVGSQINFSVVPEPSGLVLFLVGLLALGFGYRNCASQAAY